MFTPLPFPTTEAFEITQEGLSIGIIAPFAYCDESGRLAAVRCSLDHILDVETNLNYPNIYEFSFEILILSLDGSQEDRSTQDRNAVRDYVGDECRAKIMPIVLESIERLLKYVLPKHIYRVVNTIGIIEPALVKHTLITEKLQSLGYDILDCDFDQIGRPFWVMGLNQN